MKLGKNEPQTNFEKEPIDDLLSEIKDVDFEPPTREIKLLSDKARSANIETNKMTTEEWADQLAEDMSKDET